MDVRFYSAPPIHSSGSAYVQYNLSVEDDISTLDIGSYMTVAQFGHIHLPL